MTYVLAFVASGIVLVVAATVLARYADAIASATGLGRLWVGSVLLAAATSLPELGTDIAAVRLGAVDLAVGDLFGSSLANMLILAVIDLLPPRQQLLSRAAFDHVLAASLGIALNAFAAALVLLRPGFTVLGISPGSALLAAAFLAGTRLIYRHSLRGGKDPAAPPAARGDLKRASLGFAAAAAVVLLSAPAFAWSARGVAVISGLGDTFVGTWLVGISTSLPELVASIAAVRMGAFDLAVGNLFGSNLFNMAIFFALDLAHPGSIFASLDPAHAMSALLAVVMMSLGLGAIVYRSEKRFGFLEPDSALMLVVYLLSLWMLYTHVARP